MTDNMQLALMAINKWLYFGWNYDIEPYNDTYIPEFLMKVPWTCNIEHMVGKWRSATISNNPDAYLVRFYANLDSDNRRALLEWIMENYNGERHLL